MAAKHSCACCRHWTPIAGDTAPGSGICGGIERQHWALGMVGPARVGAAVVITEPGWNADVITGPEFGCSMHDEKPDA